MEAVLIPSFFVQRAVRAAAPCLFVLFCTGHWAAAQTIVITGAREPLAPERLAGDVVVIDAATIQASTADSLPDLLRREGGLQMSRNGGPGSNSSVFIRGANSGQTVLLVDGVRVGSATLGQPTFDGLSLSQVERIEVLRGPGSSLYGADAVGGVVQVFTRRGQAGTRINASAGAGAYGSSVLSAGAGGAWGLWDGAVSLARERSDGVSALRPGDAFGNYNPDRDGYARTSVQAQLGIKPAAGQRIGLLVLRSKHDVRYDGSEFLPPAFARDNRPDFRTRIDTQVTALDWRGGVGGPLVASARLSRSVDDLVSGGTVFDRYRTQRQQAGAQLAWNSGRLGQLIAAFEHSEEKARASSYAADVARRNAALVLALTGAAGRWSWQTDLRRDDNSDFGGVDTARLGGALTIVPGLRLRALAGSTFRAPSFNDLYFPGYGVPTLQPERGRSVELGLNWRSGGTDAAATVFRNRVRDLIAYEGDRSFCPADPAYDFGCARNINRARLEGATLSLQQAVGTLQLRAQLDFLEARDALTGSRLSRRAAHQESLSARWNGGAWDAGASLLRVGERPDGGRRLAAQTTLDLSAGWRFAPAWSLNAKLLNATDRDIEPARDYQGLGRQAWLTLRYEASL